MVHKFSLFRFLESNNKAISNTVKAHKYNTCADDNGQNTVTLKWTGNFETLADLTLEALTLHFSISVQLPHIGTKCYFKL